MGLLRVCVVLAGGAVRLEYNVGACSRMSFCVMYAYHVGWTRVDAVVGFVGSLRRVVSAGRSSVILRVSKHVRSFLSKPCCFLFGNLASIASVCCI